MKNLIVAVWSIFLLASCSSPSSNEAPPPAASPYNPPSWIHGTWGYTAVGNSPSQPLYKFSADNVCQLTSVQTICWKEGINTNPQGLSGSETITGDTYTCSLSGGGTNITLMFKKVSVTKILWITNSSGGGSTLEKLN